MVTQTTSCSGPPREVLVAADLRRLADAAAERFTEIAEMAVARAGRFTVALAGTDRISDHRALFERRRSLALSHGPYAVGGSAGTAR